MESLDFPTRSARQTTHCPSSQLLLLRVVIFFVLLHIVWEHLIYLFLDFYVSLNSHIDPSFVSIIFSSVLLDTSSPHSSSNLAHAHLIPFSTATFTVKTAISNTIPATSTQPKWNSTCYNPNSSGEQKRSYKINPFWGKHHYFAHHYRAKHFQNTVLDHWSETLCHHLHQSIHTSSPLSLLQNLQLEMQSPLKTAGMQSTEDTECILVRHIDVELKWCFSTDSFPSVQPFRSDTHSSATNEKYFELILVKTIQTILFKASMHNNNDRKLHL